MFLRGRILQRVQNVTQHHWTLRECQSSKYLSWKSIKLYLSLSAFLVPLSTSNCMLVHRSIYRKKIRRNYLWGFVGDAFGTNKRTLHPIKRPSYVRIWNIFFLCSASFFCLFQFSFNLLVSSLGKVKIFF